MKAERPRVNAALFHQVGDTDFRERALDRLERDRIVLISDRPGVLVRPVTRRIPYAEVGLDLSPMDDFNVAEQIAQCLDTDASRSALVVDMAWAQAHVVGGQIIGLWERVAEKLAEQTGVPVVSLYARERLVEQHMVAAFRAHPQFLAPSGFYSNPHWLPDWLAQGSTLDEQIAFLLGRVVPDYSGARFFTQDDRMFARATLPDWLSPQTRIGTVLEEGARWQIYCFGQLRVYLGGQERVDWQAPGASPRKTKALFAYLLQCGERGADASALGELLWPETGTEEQKRARLHHTIAMLRKALRDKSAVARSGDYYRLSIPPGSWIDISSFEQLCRRGLSLAKSGRSDLALEQYRTAEQLYLGDLFADLPAEYVHATGEDWINPKRIWLREMAIKLHRDTSILLRADGRLREAQEHCAKALALDPVSEDANCETLRVLHAQNRYDAMSRHFRQYKSAMAAMGGSVEYQEIQALFRALASSNPQAEKAAKAGAKEKPKAAM